jgi:hypothetical protein
VWARFRYPVLGPVSGERPMRATGKGREMKEIEKRVKRGG